MFIDYSGGGGEMEIYDSVSITLIESINQTRAREPHMPNDRARREGNIFIDNRAVRDESGRAGSLCL